MLSSVLKSERAIQINILIIKAFVRLRNILSTHKELADKINALENRVGQHDEVIIEIVREIKRIVEVENKPKPKIGFAIDKGKVVAEGLKGLCSLVSIESLFNTS